MKTLPAFMTKTTLSVARMSASGSPGTATMSACLPFSSVPMSGEAQEVGGHRTGRPERGGGAHAPGDHQPELPGVQPVGRDAGVGAERDTIPAFTARRNISSCASRAAFALTAMAGGNFSVLPPVHCPARSVGTRKVPLVFMRARVSSVRNEPCSIESIPALTAARAARSPCEWAAVRRPSRWASSTMAASSSSVSCG